MAPPSLPHLKVGYDVGGKGAAEGRPEPSLGLLLKLLVGPPVLLQLLQHGLLTGLGLSLLLFGVMLPGGGKGGGEGGGKGGGEGGDDVSIVYPIYVQTSTRHALLNVHAMHYLMYTPCTT